MSNPAAKTTSGAGSLEYLAQTWTLAYARSSWVGSGQGQVKMSARPDGEGWTITSELPITLEHAELWYEGWRVELGSVSPGVPVEVIDWENNRASLSDHALHDPAEPWGWAMLYADVPELGRGHLDMRRQPVLIGTTERQVEPLVLLGLSPVSDSITLYRAPLVIEQDGQR